MSLNIDLSKVEILNNNGSAEYTFVSNGRFVFRLRLIDTGYEFDYPVEVSWIKEGEPPVINGGNESTGTQIRIREMKVQKNQIQIVVLFLQISHNLLLEMFQVQIM